MPLLSYSHDSEAIVQPPSTSARGSGLGTGTGTGSGSRWNCARVYVLGLQPHYVCSGNFFCSAFYARRANL